MSGSIFTRRHYIWLAQAIGEVAADLDNGSRTDLLELLADQLAAESPGFDRDLFIRNASRTIFLETRNDRSEPIRD